VKYLPAIAVFLFAALADAAPNPNEPKPWSVDASVSWVVLGGKRTTGGFAPTLAGRHEWQLGELVRLQLGLSASVFGFSDDSRNIGFFVGPTVGIGVDPKKWGLTGAATIAGDYGRAPVCNDWGLCLRYWGLWPKGTVAVAYAPSESLAVVAGLSARFVDTLGWSGFSWEPAVGGRVQW
jgi:hypothetical protein